LQQVILPGWLAGHCLVIAVFASNPAAGFVDFGTCDGFDHICCEVPADL
jgi:hypothetical protein